MASHIMKNKKSNKPPRFPFLISHRLTSHQHGSHDLYCGPCVLSGVASAQSWFRIKNVSQPLTGVGRCGPGRGESKAQFHWPGGRWPIFFYRQRYTWCVELNLLPPL